MSTTLDTEVRDQKSEVRDQASETSNLTSDLRPLTSSSASALDVLCALPNKQQEVLRLKFQGGLSYAEIAGVMQITVNHVGVLIHTAIKALRERMEFTEQKSDVRGQKSESGRKPSLTSDLRPLTSHPGGEVLS